MRKKNELEHNYRVAQDWLDEKFRGRDKATVTEIEIDTNYIEGHLDLSDFENLISLVCVKHASENGITSVDISKCSLLCYFDLFNNELTQVDLSKNPQLTIFRCGKNKLTSLDVSKNPNLIGLYVNENNLTQLNLNENPKLRTLFCFKNPQLKKIDLSKTAITQDGYVYLEKNQRGRDVPKLNEQKWSQSDYSLLATNLPKEAITFSAKKGNENESFSIWKKPHIYLAFASGVIVTFFGILVFRLFKRKK